MTEAQRMLVLLDELGVHICPLVRTVVDMDAAGEVVGEGDAIALLRMCARTNPASHERQRINPVHLAPTDMGRSS